MEQKNYYKILGVSHEASVGEITKAFYELAGKYDPHVNPGNRKAEENFKEVNEAYEVLSNLEKRRKYDALLSKWPPDLDSQKQPPPELGFSDFFEGIFGRSKPKSPGPRKGEDIEQPVEMTLQEAYAGTARTYNIQSTEACSRCLGIGKVDNKVCANCNGQGSVVRNKRIQVKIRAGVETGSKIRVAGEGQPGTSGGSKGDLFLIISVKRDPLFERQGDDLYTNIEVERNIAINGGEVAVLTPDGRKLMLAIPAGTQGDRLFRLAGKGMPRLRAEGNGNLYARVRVIPGTIEPDVEKQPGISELPSMQLAPEGDKVAGFTPIAEPPTIVGPERVKEHLLEEERGMNSRMGQRLGNYRLNRLLGSGGFADVYLAAHMYLKTLAAIKILHTHLTQHDLEDFTREAQTIALLKHPHIIRVLDFGIDGTIPYLVMDYAPRGTLRQQHPRGGIVSLTTVVSYLKQVASALQYAHDAKLIHRDVKPENMLLGSNNEIVLSDFGIAVVAHSTSSLKTQNSFGTIHYMAPEQIHGKPRPASDQYSLGVIAYEWLTGSRPFNGSSYIEIAMQHIDASPQSPRERISTIPVDVEQVILKALSKDPSQRFGSVQDFATALEQASQ